jgi:hypothetical protein
MTAWLFGLVLIVTLVEAAALVLFRFRTKSGLPARDILFHLSAGALVLLAAWLAVQGVGWGWSALCLALSGPCHVIDLWRRWRLQNRYHGPGAANARKDL